MSSTITKICAILLQNCRPIFSKNLPFLWALLEGGLNRARFSEDEQGFLKNGRYGFFDDLQYAVVSQSLFVS